MYRPCEDTADCNTYRCVILSIIDHMIFGYFAIEMVNLSIYLFTYHSGFQVIKIIALGFYGENTYLSDTWNRLDFFIVMAG